MVSVAVMKDPDGGAMQGSRAYVVHARQRVSRCRVALAGGEQHLTSGIDHDDSRTSCHRFG